MMMPSKSRQSDNWQEETMESKMMAKKDKEAMTLISLGLLSKGPDNSPLGQAKTKQKAKILTLKSRN